MSLELGPCHVLFGAKDAEVDIGKTEGGVVVNFATDVVDLMSDQFGTSPEEQVVTGQKTTITCPMAEVTLANLAFALNQSLKTSGEASGIAGENIVGLQLSTKAQSLLLKKYIGGGPSEDTQNWLRFPKAAPQGTFDFGFSKDSQRIASVVFTAFSDDNQNLYYIGDEAAAVDGS